MQTVYSLSDPRTDQVRYVGITGNLKRRFRNHLNCFDRTHRACWIKSLTSIGLKPIIVILEQVDRYFDDAERAWILGFRQAGADLTNLTDGGDGTFGRLFTNEAIEKMKSAKVNVSEKTRNKLRRTSLGNNHPRKRLNFSSYRDDCCVVCKRKNVVRVGRRVCSRCSSRIRRENLFSVCGY
jgi:hypothetical protein